MKFIVQKGIPVNQHWGKWAQLSEDMTKGDSVLMSEQEMKSFREHLRRKGILSAVRKNPEGEGDQAYRLWRRS